MSVKYFFRISDPAKFLKAVRSGEKSSIYDSEITDRTIKINISYPVTKGENIEYRTFGFVITREEISRLSGEVDLIPKSGLRVIKNVLLDIYGVELYPIKTNKTRIIRFKDVSNQPFGIIISQSHLAGVLGIPLQKIWWAIHTKPQYFSSYELKKPNGGVRKIFVLDPRSIVARAQRAISRFFSASFTPAPHVYSYVPGKSIVDAAAELAKCKTYDHDTHETLIYHIDLQDFFNQITKSMIIRTLEGYGYPNRVAYIIAELTTGPLNRLENMDEIASEEERVELGLYSSPVISNIMFHGVDMAIQKLLEEPEVPWDLDEVKRLYGSIGRPIPKFIFKEAARQKAFKGICIVRYSDDIMIAHKTGDKRAIESFAKEVIKTILENNWRINKEKTGFMKEPVVFGISIASGQPKLRTSLEQEVRHIWHLMEAKKLAGDSKDRPQLRLKFPTRSEALKFANKLAPFSKLTFNYKGKDIKVYDFVVRLKEEVEREFVGEKFQEEIEKLEE